MLLVRELSGKLGAHDGDDGGQGVGEVVHRVQGDGDGVGHDAHEGLEGREKDVGQDADDAGADDDFFPVQLRSGGIAAHKQTLLGW